MVRQDFGSPTSAPSATASCNWPGWGGAGLGGVGRHLRVQPAKLINTCNFWVRDLLNFGQVCSGKVPRVGGGGG